MTYIRNYSGLLGKSPSENPSAVFLPISSSQFTQKLGSVESNEDASCIVNDRTIEGATKPVEQLGQEGEKGAASCLRN